MNTCWYLLRLYRLSLTSNDSNCYDDVPLSCVQCVSTNEGVTWSSNAENTIQFRPHPPYELAEGENII